ncbi:hypothetical protein KTQ42_23165 [Noviherbaspirillum sp. L7-7A]|uniref:hypothetical protein n=1 Tax=Noviherbaspirillum sp. L7-7A TaxID=2850560 RepID=UPI001C2C4DD4|nr:hypothetical protein [Noviherbaspirillum sp. L7-7A]MBV0882179.1 hypothetical protein [Noviherbaspirillum sp. L7-7A]
MAIVGIGLDIAKSLFQVHGIHAHSKVVLKKSLSSLEMVTFFSKLRLCLIRLEAYAGADYWPRELCRQGHTVRLMTAQFVTPYCKNDANDTEAICKAVGRPNMRFVPVKRAKAQAILTLHRARDFLVSERIALSN